MFAMSFKQLQADVQDREVLDHYPCIGITDNVRCTSVLSDQKSLASLQKILGQPSEELSVESIRRAGQLSLCARHAEAQGSQSLSDEQWFCGIPPDSTIRRPSASRQLNSGSYDEAAPHRDFSTPQSSRLSSPKSISERPSHLREWVTASDSALGSCHDIPSLTFTPSPQESRHSRSMSVSETPTRNPRGETSKHRRQSGARNISALSPQFALTSAEKNSYPSFEKIHKAFQGPNLRSHRCIAKRGGGICKAEIDDAEILTKLRKILATPIADLEPVDVRGVICLLVCAIHPELQHPRIEAQWRDTFPHFPEDFGPFQSAASTPSKRRSSTVSLGPSEGNSTSRQSSKHRLPQPESEDNDALIAADADMTSSGQTNSHIPNLEVIEDEAVSNICSVEDISQDTPSADERVDAAHQQSLLVTSVKRNLSRPQTKNRRTSSANNSDEPESLDSRFNKGECYNWAPSKIREGVAAIFMADLPAHKSSGSLYLFKAKDSEYVKIGYTLRDWRKRKTEIEATSLIMFDNSSTYVIERIPVATLLRLEELVHADLAYFQRCLRTKQERTQHEWFEVDFEEAKKTAQFWKRQLETPQASLDDGVLVAVDGERDKVNWPSIHQNHRLREEVWKTSIKTPSLWPNRWARFCGGGKVWLTGFVLIFFLALIDPGWSMVGACLMILLWSVNLIS